MRHSWALGSPDPTPEFIGAITELLGNQGITVDPEEPTELNDAELVAAPAPRPVADAPDR